MFMATASHLCVLALSYAAAMLQLGAAKLAIKPGNNACALSIHLFLRRLGGADACSHVQGRLGM